MLLRSHGQAPCRNRGDQSQGSLHGLSRGSQASEPEINLAFANLLFRCRPHREGPTRGNCSNCVRKKKPPCRPSPRRHGGFLWKPSRDANFLRATNPWNQCESRTLAEGAGCDFEPGWLPLFKTRNEPEPLQRTKRNWVQLLNTKERHDNRFIAATGFWR